MVSVERHWADRKKGRARDQNSVFGIVPAFIFYLKNRVERTFERMVRARVRKK